MKYLLACFIIPAAQMLFVVAIVLGALLFGVGNLLGRMRPEKSPTKSKIPPRGASQSM